MPLSPEEIEGRRFLAALRGYDKDEVDSFLREVAAAYREAIRAGQQGPGQDAFTVLGDRVASVLRTATEVANQLRAEAEEEREAARQEHREAASLRERAENEVDAIMRGEAVASIVQAATEGAKEIVADAERKARQFRAGAEQRAREILAGAEQRARAIREAAATEAAQMVQPPARRTGEAIDHVGSAPPKANDTAVADGMWDGAWLELDALFTGVAGNPERNIADSERLERPPPLTSGDTGGTPSTEA